MSWLLPAALVLLVAGLAVTLRAPRTDRLRAALLLWGGWTLVTGVVFSFMSGTMHPYYTVALAPGIAALVGVGAVAFWRQRAGVVGRLTQALAAAATAAWAFVLLAPSDEAFAWVRWVVLAAGVVAGGLPRPVGRLRQVAVAGVAAAVVVGAGGAGRVRRDDRGHRAQRLDPVGGDVGERDGWRHQRRADRPSPRHDVDLVGRRVLRTVGGGLELASGTAVMSTGGWSGSDAAVTLARFQAAVANGEIHYYVGGGQGGGPGGSSDSTSAQIAAWVEANYPATTVGGQTVYDLTT